MVSKVIAALCVEQDLTHTAIVRVLVRAKTKDVDTQSLEYFQERLQTVKAYAESVNKTHARLLAEVVAELRPGILYFSSDQYEAILDSIHEASEYFLDLINRIHNTRATDPCVNPAQATSSSINLPKLQFPKFKSAIHNNISLSNTQKLQYLKSSLSGEAYEILKTYAVTDKNYASAWCALCDRFENERIIKAALLNKLFALPMVGNSNLSGLCKLVDTYKQVTESMKNLGSPISTNSPLLVHLIVQRFEFSLKREWEVSIADEADFLPLALLDKFLLSKLRTLEAMSLSTSGSSKERAPSKSQFNSFNTTMPESFEACPACHGRHRLHTCGKFRGMSTSNRYQLVCNARRCNNCLASGHRAAECPRKFQCRKFSQLHHSLLHVDKVAPNDSTKQNTQQVNAHFNASKHPEVLLATALISAVEPNGKIMPVRALLDIGSETSFVSEKVAQHLGLPRFKANIQVAGIGDSQAASPKYSTTFTVNKLNVRKRPTPVNAYILRQLTTYAPKPFDASKHPELSGIQLADPHPPTSGKVDVVLGADVYGEILHQGIIRLSGSRVIAQNTKVGWVLSGSSTKSKEDSPVESQHHVITAHLSKSRILEKLWKVEEVPTSTIIKEEDKYCEEHFLKTYKRDDMGRFIVKLLFKEGYILEELGESKHRALGSYNRLQGQFEKGKIEYEQYENFMTEYEHLGHMQKVHDSGDIKRIYLPQHAVIREHSTFTKLRVVFNASCPTSMGRSLNDVLCVGPKLQNDIVSILTNWRFYTYVIVADIENMFRQVLISEEDRKYQCIFWNNVNSSRPLTYELNTITYGSTSAPYLAMRAIKQLLVEDGNKYPVAAELLKTQIYVDDVLVGAHTIPALSELKSQTIELLEKGGFVLKKWASNCSELVTTRAIPEGTTSDVIIQCPETPDQKVLGISWSPAEDSFTVKTSTVDNGHITKRFILSTVGKLFDPLGWLSPIVVKAKILLQELWVTGLNWDDPLPEHLRSQWIALCEEYPKLEKISILRWVHVERKETKTRRVTVLLQQPKHSPFFVKFSSWTKTLNVTAYVMKFIRLCKEPMRTANFTYNLSREDVERATVAILKITQHELFSDEVSALEQGSNVSLKSPLSKLSPFLDENGIVRVGGRLEWAEGLIFDQRHPIILDKHHLLIRYYHANALHAGLQLTLQLVRNKYWIMNALNRIKSVIHNCVTCARHAAKLECEKMSPLPQSRCSPSKAFSLVGVDYAGPFLITTTAGCGHHTTKVYIALFVCFSTRAIHLEVATNYATSGLMSAFHRFTARRGFPDTIYSDNGTNFQGANSELRKVFKIALRDPSLHNYFMQENVQWQFIPPSAPHFGGLWEAGVKSVKQHLKRMIGKFTPTLESFSTLLCRIEAGLNSRPLCKLSDNPDDLNTLTPGHFLTGNSLRAPPEPSYLQLRDNRLSRWQPCQK